MCSCCVNLCSKSCPHFLPVQDIWASLATPNLHHLVCQLAEQERLLGDIVAHFEVWVERCIQEAKRTTKFKTVEHPEKVIGNRELVKQALWRMKYSGPVPLQSGEEMWEARPHRERLAGIDVANWDPLWNDAALSSMADKGTKVPLDQVDNLRDCLIKYLHLPGNATRVDGRRLPDIEHLQKADWSEHDAWMHRLVQVQGQQRVTCTEYNRQRKSQSYWVLVDFQGYDMPGRVNKYVRVGLPPHPDGTPRMLRVALCDFWGRLNPWGNEDIGGPVHRLILTEPSHKDYAISLDSISGQLVSTWIPVADGRQMMLFVGYDHLSGLK